MGKQEKERIFRMKRFKIRHSISANKVGVDGVLVGAWTDVEGRVRILDAGCGCGLIALMLAQRNPSSNITGIDIDPGAVEEANENVADSPWKERIEIKYLDFSEIKEKYDLIVSNPPFFHSGIETENRSFRLIARHAGTLSPETLILRAPDLLLPEGKLSFIAQAEYEETILKLAKDNNLFPCRLLRIKGNPNAPVKRIIFEFIFLPNVSSKRELKGNRGFIESSPIIKDEIKAMVDVTEENLTIEISPGNYTEDYKAICRNFYIIF